MERPAKRLKIEKDDEVSEADITSLQKPCLVQACGLVGFGALCPAAQLKDFIFFLTF